ncbi:unnamed protein product, partial [marine sediment metagenome]
MARIPSDNPAGAGVANGATSINAATSHIETKFREMRERISQLGSEKQQLVLRLQSRERDLDAARTELTFAESQRRDLAEKLAATETRLGQETAPADSASASTPPRALEAEVETLRAQLTIARASIAAAGDRAEKLFGELESATREIDILKEERNQLIVEGHQMTALLSDL